MNGYFHTLMTSKQIQTILMFKEFQNTYSKYTEQKMTNTHKYFSTNDLKFYLSIFNVH